MFVKERSLLSPFDRCGAYRFSCPSPSRPSLHLQHWHTFMALNRCSPSSVSNPLHALPIYRLSLNLLYLGPVRPSIVSYLLGLVFYATHIPERFIAPDGKWSHWLDYIGGGSHAIWHAFIVLAISQHRAAIARMRNGIECGNC
jgi:hypothetical protein